MGTEGTGAGGTDPDDKRIAKELRRTERAYERAQARADDTREARNAAVWAALDAGWSYGEIAEATGLTRGRIGQIASALRK